MKLLLDTNISWRIPKLCYEQHYLDVVVVPANIGKYIIKNLGNQPVYMHKTMLRE